MRSARCSWSSVVGPLHPRHPAATAFCAPSCTSWTWQVLSLPSYKKLVMMDCIAVHVRC